MKKSANETRTTPRLTKPALRGETVALLSPVQLDRVVGGEFEGGITNCNRGCISNNGGDGTNVS